MSQLQSLGGGNFAGWRAWVRRRRRWRQQRRWRTARRPAGRRGSRRMPTAWECAAGLQRRALRSQAEDLARVLGAVDAAPGAHVGRGLVPALDVVGGLKRRPVGHGVALGQQRRAHPCGGGGRARGKSQDGRSAGSTLPGLTACHQPNSAHCGSRVAASSPAAAAAARHGRGGGARALAGAPRAHHPAWSCPGRAQRLPGPGTPPGASVPLEARLAP